MISKIKKSKFIKNSITLISSSIIVQLLTILSAPILTRIFSPSDFGLFGIYLSILILFNVFSTLGYSNAVLITLDDSEALKLMTICLYNLILITIISIVLIIILKNVIIYYFNFGYTNGVYLFLIPANLFANGLNVILSVWANRKTRFKQLAYSRIGGAVISPVISILGGLLSSSFLPLLVGPIIGQLVFTSLLWSQSIKLDKKIFDFESTKNLFYLYKRHQNFLYYSIPASFINTFTNQVPTITLSNISTTTTVGHYNMSNRMLGLPSVFIAGSIGEVFMQRAAKDFLMTGSCRLIFKKTLKMLFLVAVPIFGIIYFAGPQIFSIYFGSNWRSAGEFSRIMSLMFFFRFFVSPLTSVYYIAGKQFENLILHLIMVLISVVILFFFRTVSEVLWFYSISYSIFYIIFLVRSYKFSEKID